MKVLDTNFSGVSVLVVGDIMLDRYWYGDTNKISPEAPVPVVKVNQEQQRPGGAGNVALNIASLGASVEIISLVGDDDVAYKLQEVLSKGKVKTNFSVVKNLPTPIKLRILSRRQQLLRTDFEQSFAGVDKTELLVNFTQQITSVDVVILSDYGKGVLSRAQELISACNMVNKPVLVDPKGSDFSRYQGATLITPNRNEFELVVGGCNSLSEIARQAQKLLTKYNIKAFLITLSEDGMMLVENGNKYKHLPTKAYEIFDVTGAGDTVIATFATAIAAGFDYAKAMEIANVAAGIVVAKLGTSTVSLDELQRVLAKSNNFEPTKIYDVNSLTTILQNQDGVVMTNGCFDLLHAGHVSYLKAAKQLGKKLIVAVNSDESIARLKGKNRPIQPLVHRLQILAGLECVDFVIAFDEDTPEKLYCEILPDVLVKGGDYKIDEIAGAQCVHANGGEIKVLHFVDGQSTTKIIEKIKGLT